MPIRINNKDVESTINTAETSSPGFHTGAYYMADNPTYWEPQRTNNFEFIVPGLAAKLPAIVNNTYAKTNADEVLRLAVEESSVPHFSLGVIEIQRGNTKIKYAGVPTFGAGSLTVNDWIGAGVKDVLHAWQRKAFDVRTEKIGIASDYKLDYAYLQELTPDSQVVRTWKMYGVWVSEVSEGNYNHASEGVQKVSVTFQYDKADIDTDDIA